jgi:hypothetical protein
LTIFALGSFILSSAVPTVAADEEKVEASDHNDEAANDGNEPPTIPNTRTYGVPITTEDKAILPDQPDSDESSIKTRD